ncbi:MAG: hypothetical protein ACJ77Z_01850 [Thermoleophilaceae bacterium]
MRPLILAVLASLVLVPCARARLVYERDAGSSTGYAVWSANDDGSGAVRIANGEAPKISPDGSLVAYSTYPAGVACGSASLRLVAASGGTDRRLLGFVSGFNGNTVWAPDSRTLAAVGLVRRSVSLVLIDAATGAQRVLARGLVHGVSFSPDGRSLVFARGGGKYGDEYALWIVDRQGGRPRRLTFGRRDEWPLWGPKAIFFTRSRTLFAVSPRGAKPLAVLHRRLRRGRSLTPIGVSADGSRLVAELYGPGVDAAETVNPDTGAASNLGLGPRAVAPAALSSDGNLILGTMPANEPVGRTSVVTIPYGGGPPSVLAQNADEPAWSGAPVVPSASRLVGRAACGF